MNIQNPIISVKNLTVSYNKTPVLWNIDMELPSGMLIGIIGPNGAGKSTLMKALMGVISIHSGKIDFWGKPLSEVRQKISYVPQRGSVDWDFPASVFDVVMMGRYGKLGLFKRPTSKDKDIVEQSLKLLDIQNLKKRHISELSGGQQQRVFLARAISQQADIYLLDEPFAAVDATTESSIIDLLKKMTAEGKTIIVVHHDLNSVTKYFEWLVMLNLRLVASGSTETIFNNEKLKETYGSNLSLLTEVADTFQKKNQYLF